VNQRHHFSTTEEFFNRIHQEQTIRVSRLTRVMESGRDAPQSYVACLLYRPDDGLDGEIFVFNELEPLVHTRCSLSLSYPFFFVPTRHHEKLHGRDARCLSGEGHLRQ
jgi:hypothetical protein